MNPDAIVIGAGPNGLVAANLLADSGRRVLVLEQHPSRPGGAVASEALTLPGFIHDVGAGFFPFGRISPAFQTLKLEQHGLAWASAKIQSCHPAPDGSVASLSTDDDRTAASFGIDGDAWRTLIGWHRKVEDRLLTALLGPLPGIASKLRLLPLNLFKFTAIALRSGRGFSESRFQTSAARRVLPGLALHVDLGPDDRFSAALGYMLGTLAATQGNLVPIGGAGAVTAAMVRRLTGLGGEIRVSSQVDQIIVRDRQAVAIRLNNGDEIPCSGPIMADTGAPALYLHLLRHAKISGRVLRSMTRYPRGWGAFKVDWALDGPVPWTSEEARQAAVVHAGDDLDDLSRFTQQVRAGELPDNPYLVIGQQSLVDPSRAPTGQHTLWVYSRVPSKMPGGWNSHREAFADRIETRIEALAPGFRAKIRARNIVTPPDLEAMDPNLVGGDLGGGSNQWTNQLIVRPVFPYFRYRTPVRGVYLCSSYAHPGAGVHGMCGYNAAQLI